MEKKKLKWSKRQLFTLERAWKKWDLICRDGSIVEEGLSDCQCCQYYYNYAGKSCNFCPIKLYTGFVFCRRTPYMQWLRLVRCSRRYRANTPLRRAAAEVERDFITTVIEAGR